MVHCGLYMGRCMYQELLRIPIQPFHLIMMCYADQQPPFLTAEGMIKATFGIAAVTMSRKILQLQHIAKLKAISKFEI
eukprot:scaffold30076_cov76-Attheya_sp.AAC.3